jgi:hypothetical protein
MLRKTLYGNQIAIVPLTMMTTVTGIVTKEKEKAWKKII